MKSYLFGCRSHYSCSKFGFTKSTLWSDYVDVPTDILLFCVTTLEKTRSDILVFSVSEWGGLLASVEDFNNKDRSKRRVGQVAKILYFWFLSIFGKC